MTNHRRMRAALAALMALAWLALAVPALESPAQAAQNDRVRVHLTRLGSISTLSLETTCEYNVNGDASRRIAAGAKIKITLSGGALKLSVNGGSAASMGAKFQLVRGREGNQGIRFTSPSQPNLYCGDLQLSIASGKIKPVLNIQVEDYLYGVVGYEMSDSYPIEALKAQAVAARSLGVGNIKTTGSHDVTDNTYSQMFKGLDPKLTNVIRAVDQTRGVVAYYGGKVAILYYADSNGGQIEATKNVWGNTLGYSVVKDDPYDLANPGSRVKSLTVPKKQSGALTAALIGAMAADLTKQGLKTGSGNVTIAEILRIEPLSPKYPAPSRNYQKLRFQCAVKAKRASTGAAVNATVSAELETYGYLKNKHDLALQTANMELFTVRDAGDSFVIEARRWGHGIGMSQRGAQWMAKQHGKSYRDILAFYYPGIELRSIGTDAPAPAPEPTPEPGSPDEIERPATLKLLKPGSKGQAVLLLQKRLLALGYFRGTPAGNYQALTTSAVKRFQYQWGLTTSGAAEPELQGLLYNPNAPKYGTERAPLMLTISSGTGSKTVAVRASASSSAKIKMRLNDGAAIRVLSISGKWCKISISGKSGYVLKKYIHFG